MDRPTNELEGSRWSFNHPKVISSNALSYSNSQETNNEDEYEAILRGLDLAKAAGALSVILYSDSQVVIGHINGDYEAKGE